jgi:hypothetical protein
LKINQAKVLLKNTLRRAIEKNIYIAVEFESGPGMGKSSIVEQTCCEMSVVLKQAVAYIPFFLSTVEPPDVRGYGVPIEAANGRRRMVYTDAPWLPGGDLGYIAEGGKLRRATASDAVPKCGIVCLDEFRQAQLDTQKPAAELLLKRRVGESQLDDGYIVVACSNRESDRSGVQRELMFVTNRRMLITIEPNCDAWADWAEKEDIHPLAIAFAKHKPHIVFADKVPEKSGPFCTPRSLVMASYLIGEMDMEDYVECASGLIGTGAAAEFVAFLRVAEELPSFEQIVKDPKGTPIPTRPDACYAAMQMVAHRVDVKTAFIAFTYLSRMQKEFQVAGLRAAFNRVPQLVMSQDFAGWLRDNKSLVMAANLIGKKGA